MIDNAEWQEWTFRLGCWLLIIGIHFWLLLYISDNRNISWESQAISSQGLSLSFPILKNADDKASNDNVTNKVVRVSEAIVKEKALNPEIVKEKWAKKKLTKTDNIHSDLPLLQKNISQVFLINLAPFLNAHLYLDTINQLK